MAEIEVPGCYKLKMIFGDHLSIELPADVQDVSLVRDIPDNQEVFTHSATDQSIIFDILEYVDKPDEQALKIHYEDIAGANESDDPSADILQVEEVPLEQLSMKECSAAYVIKGRQMVAKFKETAKNTIHVTVALFRLPQFETDVIVSFNNPVNINPESSSHGPVPVSTIPWTEEDFKHCLSTLKILDTALFGS